MKPIHVMAGVIRNPAGDVLLARRPHHSHQGGLWEFPGGKREAGESTRQALRRELHEELGIEVQQARPLIQIHHDYGDKRILLDVWDVTAWHGTPWGREGQPVQWCAPAALRDLAFPAANLPVIQAVQLPAVYAISPDPADTQFLPRLQKVLAAGVRLVQLRARNLSADTVAQAMQWCESYGARLLVNAGADFVHHHRVHGVHLNSRRLTALRERPLDEGYLLAASCHCLAEIHHANTVGVDFVVLSPVRPTASHPTAQPLGWRQFAELAAQARCPVYALGGMSERHLDLAWAHGAQGVAGIRGFFDSLR